MTEAELREISAQLQVNELNPARLQAIQADALKDAGYAGLALDVVGYAPPPAGNGTTRVTSGGSTRYTNGVVVTPPIVNSHQPHSTSR